MLYPPKGFYMFIMLMFLKLFIHLGACNLILGHVSIPLSQFVLVSVVLFLLLTGRRGYQMLVGELQVSVDVCVPYS